MKRFTIRSIFIAMLMVAIGLALFKSMRGKPRPYHSLEHFVDMYSRERFPNGTGWEVYLTPDVDGPYRTTGDDWRGTLPYQTNPGQSFSIWIDPTLGRGIVKLPAVKGVSYKIVWLENRNSERTVLIMSQFEQSPNE